LFISPTTDFEALEENPEEYENLLTGLYDQYKPVGKTEEVEVERVAICYWRLKRAWRHENAVNLAARRDLVNSELAEQRKSCDELTKEEEAGLLELQRAKKEIQEIGEVSEEIKNRILAIIPGFERLWSALDAHALQRIEELSSSRHLPGLSSQRRSWVTNMYTVGLAIASIEQLAGARWTRVSEIAIGRNAIPNGDTLDRLLRYETTIDRTLTRALERLERLQSRRREGLLRSR
jgi:hypothetical protein